MEEICDEKYREVEVEDHLEVRKRLVGLEASLAVVVVLGRDLGIEVERLVVEHELTQVSELFEDNGIGVEMHELLEKEK